MRVISAFRKKQGNVYVQLEATPDEWNLIIAQTEGKNLIEEIVELKQNNVFLIQQNCDLDARCSEFQNEIKRLRNHNG
ncbi:MAG: hypothetical protein AB1394_07465 [Bacteroidota bacterium]